MTVGVPCRKVPQRASHKEGGLKHHSGANPSFQERWIQSSDSPEGCALGPNASWVSSTRAQALLEGRT